MLQSYSAIYCRDQQRSFHGTTVQLVQLDPNSIFNSQGNSLSTDTIIEYSMMVSGESSESHIVNINILPPNSNTKNTNTDLQVLYPIQCVTTKPQHLDRLSPSNSPHKSGKTHPNVQEQLL